jgi:hypothetical protein
LLKAIDAKSPLLMFVLPLLTIVTMVLFAVLVLFTNGILAARSFSRSCTGFMRMAEFCSPLVLAVVMIFGLILLRCFPGDQHTPIKFHDALFLYPLLLLVVAVTLKILDKQAEPATSVKSPAALLG